MKRTPRNMLTLKERKRRALLGTFWNIEKNTNIPIFDFSSGMGRAGTFVAACCLMQRLLSGAKTIDVFGTVVALRKWRPGLVQVPVSFISMSNAS